MKKLILTAVVTLSAASSASANDLAEFLGVANDVINFIDNSQRSGFDPGTPDFNYNGGNNYGGRTAEVPFTKIERDSRGQKWRVSGVRWNVGGRSFQRITNRIPLQNGVQFESGSSSLTPQFDANGNMIFHTHTKNTKVLDSASDVYRNHVDGGSKRYVNRTERDPRTGDLYRVTGYVWTSYGKPHADLKRVKVSRDAWGNIETQETNIVGSAAPQP